MPTFIQLNTRVKNCRTTIGEMASFCVDAMVRGYHEYQDIWTATSGKRLKCVCKIKNCSDLFAVAVHFGLHSLSQNRKWLKALVD